MTEQDVKQKVLEALENYKEFYFKRGIIGVYHRVSRQHLQKYVDEFVFRYNQRLLPLQDAFTDAMRCLNFRITYRDLIYANEKA